MVCICRNSCFALNSRLLPQGYDVTVLKRITLTMTTIRTNPIALMTMGTRSVAGDGRDFFMLIGPATHTHTTHTHTHETVENMVVPLGPDDEENDNLQCKEVR